MTLRRQGSDTSDFGDRDSAASISRAFEESWKSEGEPQIESFVPAVGDPVRLGALKNLIAIDLDWRMRSGQSPRLESYLQKWPELDDDAGTIDDLLLAECVCRATYTALVDLTEVRNRFPRHGEKLSLEMIEKKAMLAREAKSYLGSGRFFMLRKLGSGGMGVVYAALDRERHQVVAVKVLPNANPESLYYFKNEFRGLAEIAHPNLAALYELISIAGHWLLTMELIDGVDFLKYARGRAPWQMRVPAQASTETSRYTPPHLDETTGWWEADADEDGSETTAALSIGFDDLRSLLRQMAAAVSALHQHGTLHRDIKPSNVMVRRDGRLVVLDFGLNTQLVSQAATTPPTNRQTAFVSDASSSLAAATERSFAGTFSFMSPEQGAGELLTAASDWYSVGVLLYQTLTGRLPFQGTKSGIVRSRLESEPPDPRRWNADIPQDLHELCLGLLRREPALRWNSEQIFRILGGQPENAAAQATYVEGDAPFVGRAGELEELRRAAADVRSGATRSVHVCGHSGVGKSRLVGQFLSGLSRLSNYVVLRGKCYEGESVPYKALDSIIDALCGFMRSLPRNEIQELLSDDFGALAEIFPVLKRVEAIPVSSRASPASIDAQESRHRAFASLRELLSRLGRRWLLVLAIDDLQWGDADSAAVLAELLRPPEPPQLLLIVAYRTEYRGQSTCLDALEMTDAQALDRGQRRVIQVGPLSELESAKMVAGLFAGHAVDQRHADRIAKDSQGLPYFILEMAQYVRTGADLQQWSSGKEEVDLDDVLWQRVRQLPEPSRRLLETTAVAGQPLSLRLALDAARLAASDYPHVAMLRSQHLVRTFGPGNEDPIDVYHDRIRESIIAHLPLEDLRSHHGRLADMLSQSPAADAEWVATHYDGAGHTEQAGRYYAAAAAAAEAKLAFDRAARLYERSLASLQLSVGERRELLAKCADALANAGRGGEAAEKYLAAANGADDREWMELQRRAAYQLCISGRVDEGRAALRALLAKAHMSLPSSPASSLRSLLINRLRLFLRGTRFRLRQTGEISLENLRHLDILWTVSASLSMFDVVAGADFQTRGCILALRTGEPFRLARALAWEGAHVSNLGGANWPRTRTLLDRAMALAEQVEDPYARCWVTLCDGIAHFTNGRWRPAHGKLEQAERALRSQCRGVAWELGTAQAFTLWSLLYMGDVGEMRRRASALVAEARERGDQYAATTHSAFALPMAQLMAGEPAAARATIEEALGAWSHSGFHVQHFVGLMCHTYIDLYEGRAEDAWRRMREQWPQAVRSQLLRVQVLRAFLTHLRARSALAMARRGPASAALLRIARRDARSLIRENVPYCQPHALHLLAASAALERERAKVVAILRDVVDGYAQSDMNLFAAAAQVRLGEALGGAEGNELVSKSFEYFQSQDIRNIGRTVDAFAAEVT